MSLSSDWTLVSEQRVFSAKYEEKNNLEMSIFRFRDLDLKEASQTQNLIVRRETPEAPKPKATIFPKSGEGAQYLRQERFELQQQKYTRKINKHAPWIIEIGNNAYRGVFESGILNQRNPYWLLIPKGSTHSAKCVPVASWYNFRTHFEQNFTPDEAEQKFQEHKKKNYLNLSSFYLKYGSILKTEDAEPGSSGKQKAVKEEDDDDDDDEMEDWKDFLAKQSKKKAETKTEQVKEEIKEELEETVETIAPKSSKAPKTKKLKLEKK